MNIVSTVVEILRLDLEALKSDLSRKYDLKPGLYHYTISLGLNGTRWIHLRVNQEMQAELFIDVTHVLHLSSIPAYAIFLALEGFEFGLIRRILLQKYPAMPGNSLEEILVQVMGIYAALHQPDANCYLCALEPFVKTVPLFSKAVNVPYKVDLALTYACDNRCAHCYNEPGRKSVHSLDLAGWQAVIDKLHELGVPYLILTGGEPSHFKHVLEIIQYAEGKGMVVGMNSHGRKYSDPGFARAVKAAGLDHLQITLASHLKEIHNRTVGAAAFDETTTGIRNALAAGIHTITNTTLVKANQHHIPEIIDFLYGLGIRTFAMNSLINSGKGSSYEEGLSFAEAERCLTIAKALAEEKGMSFLWYTPSQFCEFSPIVAGVGIKRCNAAEYSMCIEPNGDVLPCQSFYQPVGNLLADPWDSIWNSELFLKIRNREGSLGEKCIDCPDLNICSGGCYLELMEDSDAVSWHC